MPDLDPVRLDRFFSDANVPQADKDAVASMLRGQTVQRDTSTALGRAGEYALGKGRELLESAETVGSAMTAGLTGGTGRPISTGEAALAGAHVAGTAIAPGASLIGTGAGATVRAAGGTQGEAEAADIAAGLGTGLVQGVRAIRGVRGAVKAGFDQVAANAAARGDQLALGSAQANTLEAAAQDVVQSVRSKIPEKRAARYVLNLLRPRTIGTTGVAVRGGPTYKELDDAYSILSKASPLRGAINDAMQGLLTPEDAAARRAAQSLFRVGVPQAGKSARWYQRPMSGVLPYSGLLGPAGKLVPSAGQMLVGGTAAGPAVARTAAVGGRAALEQARQESLATPPEDLQMPEEAPAPSEPGQPATPARRLTARPGPWGREIAAVSDLAGVPPELIESHMHLKSGGNPNALGDQGRSHGLMQIQPATFAIVAKHAGELLGRTPDLDNPFDNLLAGGLLLRRYLDKTNGDVKAAARMYNGGEGVSPSNPHANWYADTIAGDLANRTGG